MDQSILVGILCFIGMLTLVMLGIPLFVSMLLAALIGFWIIGGPSMLLAQSTSSTYNITASYAFAVIPMFILMGIMAGECGIAESAYNAVSKWVIKLRGGLLMATIVANALFGACSGVPTGGNIIFTKIALPQLDKYHYNRGLSLACIAAAGVLATLIPPSVPIVFFCILVDISIGKALMAGIVPGLLTTVVLCLTVLIISLINPNSFPTTKDIQITWKEKFVSLKDLLPIVFLFLLVMGGLYAGLFAPTVGGAVGAAGVLLYALVMRKITRKSLSNGFWDSVVSNAQIFPMFVGGYIFSRLIAVSGLANVFSNWILGIQMPVWAIVTIVMIFYIVMGCVMELMSILIITLPIIFPLLTGLGLDPYALCIVLVFIAAVGALTPPIGMACFVVAIAAKVDSIEVFRNIVPFFIADLVLIVLILIFPSIATCLPDILMK